MRKWGLLLAALALAASVQAAIPQPERDALLALYAATGGDGWTQRDNWLGAPGTECSWFGVQCDDAGTHVIALYLNGNNLSGTLPAALASLPELREIYMPENSLTGSIPAALGDLPQLQILNLSGNQLTGAIPPELGDLSELLVLMLGYNQLTGPIPSTLGNLDRLRALSLTQNFVSGPIPASIGSLSQLEFLFLDDNRLSGAIPAEMGNLAALRELSLRGNMLSGGIPAVLGGLSQLVQLDLGDNDLWGPIPVELGNLAALRSLDLSLNHLTGNIPAELGALTQLRWFSVGTNRLDGPIPESLGGLTELRFLILYDNTLTGYIPPALANLTLLEEMHLSSNHLIGPIPPELGQLANLLTLNLGENHLSESIPAALGGLTQLRYLYLGGNRLYGSIPPELGNLANLQLLDLTGNQLSGSLPDTLGQLSQLLELRLSWNQFAGPIPDSFSGLVNLVNLELVGNQMAGPFPAYLGALTHLQHIDVAWNRFSGPIPPELGNLAALRFLGLDGNEFEGGIPPALGNLAALEYLILGYNHLTGPIPDAIGNLVLLRYLWLYGNVLSGEVPATFGQLAALEAGGGLELRWNALSCSDDVLLAYLNTRHGEGEFLSSQTLTPTNFRVVESQTAGVFELRWDPTSLQAGEGGYMIAAATLGGPWQIRALIPDKEADRFNGCLCGTGDQNFIIETITRPHGMNPNLVTSLPSPTVTVSRSVTPEGTVGVLFDSTRTGEVFQDSPCQILPASFLVFAIDPAAFAGVTASDPAVIRISLPPGARLGTSLADGTLATTAPLPSAGEWTPSLAVVEFAPQKDGTFAPVPGNPLLPTIGPHAVQLLRYMEGELEILVRITESTATWTPSAPGRFIGFAMGLGAGVWPADEFSNWGPDYIGAQHDTMFYMNLRSYPFELFDNAFTVSVCAFRQADGTGLPVAFQPSCAFLFTAREVHPGPPPAASLLNPDTLDFDQVDLNQDGFTDLLSIAAGQQRMYIAFGLPGGAFSRVEWLMTDFQPQTLDIADVTGDGRPDVLLGGADGALHIFEWTQLFGVGKAAVLRQAAPAVRLKLAGVPTDSLVTDISGDGQSDYVYCEAATNTLSLMFGSDFTTTASYATGQGPQALATGDFDGDTEPDVAVANAVASSVSVYLNDGAGGFTPAEVTGLGAGPVDLESADFNADGLADLVLAAQGDKAIQVLLASAGGAFAPGHGQKLFFQQTPSAVLAENFDGQNGPDALVGFSDHYKLALCTTDAAGTLAYAFSIDIRGDVEVDPLNGSVTLDADQVLSVAGGTTYGGISSRQGVAVVQDHGIGVLHFPRSRHLSFSVVNLDDASGLLALDLYDDASGNPVRAVTTTVSAGAQYARYLTDGSLLGSDADHAGRWVRGFLTNENMHGMWLANNGNDLQYLDGTRLLDVRDARTGLAFPVLDDAAGHATELLLINPNREQAQAVLTLYGADGSARGTYAATLGGRTRRVLDAATIFPSFTSADSIQVQSDRALLGVELFGNDTALACLAAMPTAADAATLYAPHVADGDFGIVYDCRLDLVNTGTETATVALTLYDDDGTELGATDATLPARGKQSWDVSELFGLTGAVTGWLRADPGSSPGVVGSVTFGGTSGAFVSSLPLQDAGNSRFLMGHIANGTIGVVSFFTGIAIVNPETTEGGEVPVQISAYDQNGQLLDTRVVVLSSQERMVSLLHQVMPELTTLFGGYLIVENLSYSDGILVFQLFGDTSLQFLSAVPAIPLD